MDFEAISRQFKLNGRYSGFRRINTGHINETYVIYTRDDADKEYLYTLQAVNREVFKNPVRVMENIVEVTNHLRRKIHEAGGDASREALKVVDAIDGLKYYDQPGGHFWRVYEYVDFARTYDTVENPDHLRRAGMAFGRFQRQLADFPIAHLHDTIPDFHNTPKRIAALFDAVHLDAKGRVKDVKDEIEFFARRRDRLCELQEMLDKGELPLRVTHNDTKYNNILIDDATGEALCVLDLDTVMPGTAVLDFGDAIRFAANTGVEDERDLSKVALDMRLFDRFASGFVTSSVGFLTDEELRAMPLGCITITCELASRFLADHINGDTYFRIHREGQNLDRARSQIHLAKDMERRYDQMCDIVEKYMHV